MITREKAAELVQQWLNKQNEDPLVWEKLFVEEKHVVGRNRFWAVYFGPHGKPASGLVIVDHDSGKLYNTVGSSWYNWLQEFENFKTLGHSEIDWSRSEVKDWKIEQCVVKEQVYASLRENVRHEERDEKLKELLGRIEEELKRQGASISGNPEMCQSHKDEFRSDIEVKIPFTGRLQSDLVRTVSFSERKIYCTIYTGNYYDFVAALHELKRFGRVHGIKEKGEPWLEYVEYSLGSMTDTWKNKVCIQVKD
jgi:effector-binding domain-containing protein